MARYRKTARLVRSLGLERVAHAFAGSLCEVKTDRPVFHITFDDGPNPEVTPRILEVLEEFDAPATFFLLAENAERHPELVHEIVDRGHELGHHSRTHLRLSTAPWGRLPDEIWKARRDLERVAGRSIKLFRPPYGAHGLRSLYMVKGAGMQTVLWSVDSEDWKGLSPDDPLQHTSAKIGNGGILLTPRSSRNRDHRGRSGSGLHPQGTADTQVFGRAGATRPEDSVPRRVARRGPRGAARQGRQVMTFADARRSRTGLREHFEHFGSSPNLKLGRLLSPVSPSSGVLIAGPIDADRGSAAPDPGGLGLDRRIGTCGGSLRLPGPGTKPRRARRSHTRADGREDVGEAINWIREAARSNNSPSWVWVWEPPLPRCSAGAHGLPLAIWDPVTDIDVFLHGLARSKLSIEMGLVGDGASTRASSWPTESLMI